MVSTKLFSLGKKTMKERQDKDVLKVYICGMEEVDKERTFPPSCIRRELEKNCLVVEPEKIFSKMFLQAVPKKKKKKCS